MCCSRFTQKGVTLIEVMIVVVVIAILAAIALPAYTDYVRKARRSDGMDALLNAQTLQEKWRANNTTYTAVIANVGGNASSEGVYAISIVGVPNATSYTLRAVGGAIQNGDAEGAQACTTLEIRVTAGNPRGEKWPAVCWN